MHLLILASLPIAMAWIHRIRGGLFETGIKATYWIWIVVGLLVYAAGASWPVALAWAVGYLLWTLPAWMSVITRAVGATVPSDQTMASGWDVSLVDTLSLGNPVLGCFVRAGVYLLPLVVALVLLDLFDGAGPVVDAAPLLFVVITFFPAYWLGFRADPTDMSSVAEPLVGATWGVAMAAFLVLA